MVRFHSFLWQNNILLCTYRFSIRLSIDGHLGCFQILAVVNTAAVNTGCMYLFRLVFWISLDKYPGAELLGHKEVLSLIF